MPQYAKQKPTIRLAGTHDLDRVTGLYQSCAAQTRRTTNRQPFVFAAKSSGSREILRERILDRCLLLAEQQGHLIAAAGVDLERSRLGELMISDAVKGGSLFETLVIAAERRAVQFGLPALEAQLSAADERRFRSVGFVSAGKQTAKGSASFSSAARQLCMQRSLRRRQTAYGRRISSLGEELGIPPGYGRKHRLALQPEATRLTTIGKDVFGREQKLSPGAAAAWRRMQRAALEHGIELQAVSAWRPVSYQLELLQRKLDKGLSMKEILKVSAPPGFSEHHTGHAIDITTPGFAVLEDEFEHSPAYRWMERRAGDYGFRLSFPRNNRHRLAYEPWHWCFDRQALRRRSMHSA
jgi:D-alanyl-D-alanine carboxypeptidase